MLVFAAVAPGDTEKEAESLAAKVLKMKLWDDESGARVGAPFSSLVKPDTGLGEAEVVSFLAGMRRLIHGNSGRKAYRIYRGRSYAVRLSTLLEVFTETKRRVAMVAVGG